VPILREFCFENFFINQIVITTRAKHVENKRSLSTKKTFFVTFQGDNLCMAEEEGGIPCRRVSKNALRKAGQKF
jgi:hypothetical protein